VSTVTVDGIVSKQSPFGVAETVSRLTEVIGAAGAKVFAVIDQSAEARTAGQSLRETTLVLFGNPAAGTAVMAAAPLAAMDLPLKVLVFADDDGTVWMTYLDRAWLAARYQLSAELTAPLAAPAALVAKVTGGAGEQPALPVVQAWLPSRTVMTRASAIRAAADR
jgi:uncharacterized protein (DUF302 family)